MGKTDNRPPLVEADGERFVMVKTGEGEPLRAESPEGVSYTENSVTFDQVDLGDAVLDGTMECTSRND